MIKSVKKFAVLSVLAAAVAGASMPSLADEEPTMPYMGMMRDGPVGPGSAGMGMMGSGYGPAYGSNFGPGAMMGGGYGPGTGFGPGAMMGGYGGYGMGPGMGMMGLGPMGGGGFPMGMMGGMGPGMMGGYGMGPGMGMMGGGCPMMGGMQHGMMGPGAMGGGGFPMGMMGGMGPGMMGGFGGGYGMMGPMARYDLSDAQADKLRKIETDLAKQNSTLMRQMWDERQKLSALYNAEKRDPAAIGKAYDKLSAIQRKMLEARIDAENKAAAVLGDKQKFNPRHGFGWGMMGY